jgi:hypothetical protein
MFYKLETNLIKTCLKLLFNLKYIKYLYLVTSHITTPTYNLPFGVISKYSYVTRQTKNNKKSTAHHQTPIATQKVRATLFRVGTICQLFIINLLIFNILGRTS